MALCFIEPELLPIKGSTCLCSCDLDLDLDLMTIRTRPSFPECANMNFRRRDFRNLSSDRWWCIKLWDITSLGSVQVVGFFDVAARRCTGDEPIAALVGTTRSFLYCDERIQVTFPCSILSDYVHIKALCVFIIVLSVLNGRNCLVQHFC